MNSLIDTETPLKIIQFEKPLLLKIKEYTIEKLINSYDKKEKLEDILIRGSNDKSILEVNDSNLKFLGIIFKVPITVRYEKVIIENKFYTLIDEQVYSNTQIESTLKQYNILFPNIIDIDSKPINYYESIYSLFWKIRIKEINIINSFKEYQLEENKIILLENSIFKKEDLSKFFDEYFIYPNNITEFKYYPTENRQNLEENFSSLINNEKITQFKITGPSGEGKSISLLYFSRCSFNKIYLNLKTIYNLYSSSNIEKYLDLLIHEFGRLNFKNPSKKKEFENIFNKYSINNFWELLEQLSKILKEQEILLIFDQFKEKYVEKKYLDKIKENLKGKLKIIISSSINDHEIGNQVANSLIKHKDDIFKLTEDNQNDYFYYIDLVHLNDLKQLFNINEDKKSDLYDYFAWNPKFISLINQNKSKNDLKEHIIKKMKEHSSNIGIDFELYIFNIYLRINRETNYNICPLKTLSLKYCKLELGKEAFKVHYKYPIIKIIVEEIIKDVDVRKYFNNKNYEDNELYSSLKGYFFEFAAIKQINLLKDVLFEEPIKYSLSVDNLVKIKQFDGNNKNDTKTDKFNMIFEQLDNQNIPAQEITKKDLLNKNLDLVNKELTIIEREKNQKNINTELESDDEDLKEYENSEEKQSDLEDYEEGEEEDDDTRSLQIIKKGTKERDKTIDYFFYKNLKKEKNKIDKLLGKKTNKPEKKTKEKDIFLINKFKKTEKKKDLDKRVKYVEYNDDFQNGAIMITQKQTNGESLDLGVLLGDKNNKKLIGFQMEFYSKSSKLKNKITKDSIKNIIQPILLNCLKYFGIRITEWHYIMCLYYNTDDEYHFSSKLVNHCNNNDLEYIFFNPTKNKFYYSDKSVLTKIKLNMKTNVDFYSKLNPFLIFKDTGFLKNYLNQAHDNSILVSKRGLIFNLEYDTIINHAKIELQLDLEILGKFQLDTESHFPIPNISILFIFNNNNNFIYYYNLNNQLMCKHFQLVKQKFTRDYNYCSPFLITKYLYLSNRFKMTDKLYFYVFKIKNLIV